MANIYALFQSTLLQEERQVSPKAVCKVMFISIHAPTRGATKSKRGTVLWVRISIHAPTRGATFSLFCQRIFINISIHAPTRGATSRQAILFFRLHYFNPRSYKRSDSCYLLHSWQLGIFQSTLLQEERQITCEICRWILLFQSTLLQEERPCRGTFADGYGEFQSTLLQEERPRNIHISLC